MNDFQKYFLSRRNQTLVVLIHRTRSWREVMDRRRECFNIGSRVQSHSAFQIRGENDPKNESEEETPRGIGGNQGLRAFRGGGSHVLPHCCWASRDGTTPRWVRCGGLAKAAAVGTRGEGSGNVQFSRLRKWGVCFEGLQKMKQKLITGIKRGELYYLSMICLFVHFRIGGTFCEWDDLV